MPSVRHIAFVRCWFVTARMSAIKQLQIIRRMNKIIILYLFRRLKFLKSGPVDSYPGLDYWTTKSHLKIFPAPVGHNCEKFYWSCLMRFWISEFFFLLKKVFCRIHPRAKKVIKLSLFSKCLEFISWSNCWFELLKRKANVSGKRGKKQK